MFYCLKSVHGRHFCLKSVHGRHFCLKSDHGRHFCLKSVLGRHFCLKSVLGRHFCLKSDLGRHFCLKSVLKGEIGPIPAQDRQYCRVASCWSWSLRHLCNTVEILQQVSECLRVGGLDIPVPFFMLPSLLFFFAQGGIGPYLFRVCVWIGGIPFLFIMTTSCVQGGLGPFSRTVDIREAEQKAESMLRLTEPDIGAGLILFAGGKYKRRLTCFGNERDFKFYVNLHCRYNR